MLNIFIAEKKSRSIKEILQRVVILFAGLCIAHLGVTLFLLADLGSDPFNIGMLAAGCVFLAYGMTIVIKSDAGTGPNDLVAVVISDKTKIKFSFVRMAVDFSFVAAGFILGGSIEIGTIICAFLVGPVAGFFLPINEAVINKILKL